MTQPQRRLFPFGLLAVLPLALLFGLVWQFGAQQAALAASATRYVAPGGICGGASPCYASIQAAVNQAASGDEIRIAAGRYSGVNSLGGLSQVAYISKSLSLRGGYTLTNWVTANPAANPTTLDAQRQGRALAVIGPVSVTLAGLRLTGGNASGLRGDPSDASGNAGGGLYAYSTTLTIENSVLFSNTASAEASRTGYGGGIYLYGGSLALRGSTLEWNLGSPVYYGVGGGLYVNAGRAVELSDCLIQHNTGSTNPGNAGGGNGGGVYLRDSAATLTGNTLTANTGSTGPGGLSSASGGGLYLSGGSATLTRNTLSHNVASRQRAGWGGGLHITGSRATLVDNTLANNVASASTTQVGLGGGLYAYFQSVITLTGNLVRDNIAAGGGGTGWGGGLHIQATDATLVANTVTGNRASSGSSGSGGGIALQGPSVTAMLSNTLTDNTASSVSAGYGGGLYAASTGALTLTGNLLQGNVAGAASEGQGGGLHLVDSRASLARNILTGNRAMSGSAAGAGGGLYAANSDVTLVNNVLAANHANTHGAGAWFASTAPTGHLGLLVHNTIANNAGCGEGVYADGRARLALTNTIVAGHSAFGILKTLAASVSLESTLWHGNAADAGESGAMARRNDYAGDPVFAGPLTGDYHLAGGSAALDKGVDARVSEDLDGQPRPNGAAPDLGADEYYAAGGSASAGKAAFAPQWLLARDPATGQVQSWLRQRYLLQFRHNDAAGWVAVLTDTLPAALTYESELHTPAMQFARQAGSLTWQTEGALPAGQAAQVLLTTRGEHVAPLAAVTNTAGASAGPWHFGLEAASRAPVFPPLITAPGRGEICPGPLQVSGAAQPNAAVTIYENGVSKATTTADARGAFTATYASAAVGHSTVYLSAVACASQCSAPSAPIALAPPLSFICPQPSSWENTPASGPLAGQRLVYRFLDDDGRFVGDGGVFHFVPPHSNSAIHLYRRSCVEMGAPADAVERVWVEIEEGGAVVATYNPSRVNLPWYHFDIPMELADVERTVTFWLGCYPPAAAQGAQAAAAVFTARMGIGSDVQGTAFDLTRGFDPGDPGAHGVGGVTITAMVSNTAWGGWVPWPAHLYGGQANPQVTGADGYFAFLAPPGAYYLEVEGGARYQSWRSPVIQVGAQPLHINVPLTPRSQAANRVVSLGPNGPVPAVVTVAAGAVVEWSVAVDPALALPAQMALMDNPRLRPHSAGALDPLLNPLGLDGGLLIPGRAYRRQFVTPGSYAYSDGAGHSGLVVVQAGIYLPLVAR